VRSRAAETLGELRDQRTVTALIKALNDNVGRVCDEAVRSLGMIKDPSSGLHEAYHMNDKSIHQYVMSKSAGFEDKTSQQASRRT
jgi:HEAT repeat protein